MVRGVVLFGLTWALVGGGYAVAADREIPAAFAPFEHMIGSWKGTSVPAANPLKGWQETHLWAWKFAKGVPIGMSLELKGDKTLTKGALTFDHATRTYHLEGIDADGKAVSYVGALDKTGKTLVLDRMGGEGKDRLTIRPNSNLIRYTMELDHQEPGAPQFKRVIQVGLTKEGESFAAGGAAENLPKCILTGGAATMTVSYQGKSYPVCCSGCRDEFNDDPEKYAKKAALAAEQGGGKTPAKTASSRVGKDDGAFEGLDEPASKSKAASPKATRPSTRLETDAAGFTPTPSAPKLDAGALEAKASSLYRLGSNLEKSGKAASALKYYRQVIKEYPGTPSAKTAAARIKALGG